MEAISLKVVVGKTPYKLYNIGNNNPVKLMHFIETIEKAVGKEAVKEFLPDAKPLSAKELSEFTKRMLMLMI